MQVMNRCLLQLKPLLFLFLAVCNRLAWQAANAPNGYVTLDWNEPNACLAPDGYHIYRDSGQITTSLVTD